MNLLILTQYFWPETFIINDLARSLKESGVEISVLTGKPNYPEGKFFPGYQMFGAMREEFAGMSIWRVPVLPRGKGGACCLFANYTTFILSAGILAPILLFHQPIEAIFVYAPSPLLQALAALPLRWLRKVPLVIWVQDLWPESLAATGHIHNRLVLKMVEYIVRLIYRSADLILIQSEGFREAVTRIADMDKILYFPNPINPKINQSIHTHSTNAAEQIDATTFSVVFAGNLGLAQSLETILDAALMLKEHPAICFYFIGSGSQSTWVAEQIAHYQLTNVVMLGRYPVESMPSFFAKASALLVTLKDDDIFSLTIPCKLQSYLAAGRPIIAALNGEGRRIVFESQAGITCAAGDSAALSAAVIQLASLPEPVRQEMGASGRRYADTHFDLYKLTETLIDRLKNLCTAV